MKFFAKFLDVVCFVFGPSLLVANIFSFSFDEAHGDNSIAVAYLYELGPRIWIAVGVAFIAFGFLRRAWARKPPDH